MGKAQEQARPPFAFPLCRDSLCNAYSFRNGLWYAPIETTLGVLRILRNKRYYLELVWQTQRIGDNLPEALLIQEKVEDGDRWLAEKLDLGNKPLLDFLAEAFVEHFKKNKGIYTYSSLVPLDLVSPDSKMWLVKSIDFDKGEVHLIDSSRDTFTYPMPRDISPYSDVKVGDTGVEWGTLMKAAAIAFFTKYEEGHEVLIDLINRRIIDKFGVVVYKVAIPLLRIKVTGKELVFMSLQEGLWYERSNLNLFVRMASVNNIYLPAKLGSDDAHIFSIFGYEHEDYGGAWGTYLYCNPNSRLALVKLEDKYYRIEASVKSQGAEKAELALNKNTWIRILMSSGGYLTIGRHKRVEIFSFRFVIHLSKHKGERGGFFAGEYFPISAIKLMLERSTK